MSNRQRHPDESFEDYRKSLRMEQEALDWKLRGTLFHNSQKVVRVKNPNFSSDPTVEDEFVNKIVGVTYRKPE